MIVRDIPLPKVWDKNLNYIGEIRPIKVSATLTMTPLSYASVQLPKGVSVPARGFVELFSSMGSLGIFRVRSPQDAYGNDITTAELESAVTEIGDYLVLSGYDEMMPAGQAITTIFNHYRGNRWQLGSVSALGNTSIAVQADHVRVLECLISLLEQKTDCMMSFDYTTTPWTLNFVKRGTAVSAEGRLARNVNYAKVSYDDTELCTRAYFEVESTESLDPANFPVFDANAYYSIGDYVAYNNKVYRLNSEHVAGVSWADTSKSLVNDVPTTAWQYVDADTIGTYGIVEKTVYSGGEYTASEVLRVVNDFLDKHKEPRVSIEIGLEELSSITGEPFDTFRIGALCRLALIDYGVTIERNITSMSWDNIYDAPFDVVVNLENEEDTAINFIHDLDSSGGTIGGSGGGGGGGGKKKSEDTFKKFYTDFQKTDYYLDLYAREMKNANEILRQAGLYISAGGTLLYADNNNRQIGGKIKVEADKVALVVGTRDGGNYIKVAEIATAINDAGEGVAYIDADHINISATSDVHTLAGDIEHDANGNLVIKNGGGLRVRKTSSGVTTEYGVYDENNLTGGVVVNKINGQTSTYITGDHINISATNQVHTLAGEIEHDAQGRLVIKNAGGLYVKRTEQGLETYSGVFDDGNLTAGVIATKINGTPSTYIQGENIYIGNEQSTTVINGKLNASELNATRIQSIIGSMTQLQVATLYSTGGITCGGQISTTGNISASGSLSVSGHNMNVYEVGYADGVYTFYRITGGNYSFKPSTIGTLTYTWSFSGGKWTVDVKNDGTKIGSTEQQMLAHENCIGGLTRDGYISAGSEIDTSGYYWHKSSNDYFHIYYS